MNHPTVVNLKLHRVSTQISILTHRKIMNKNLKNKKTSSPKINQKRNSKVISPPEGANNQGPKKIQGKFLNFLSSTELSDGEDTLNNAVLESSQQNINISVTHYDSSDIEDMSSNPNQPTLDGTINPEEMINMRNKIKELLKENNRLKNLNPHGGEHSRTIQNVEHTVAPTVEIPKAEIDDLVFLLITKTIHSILWEQKSSLRPKSLLPSTLLKTSKMQKEMAKSSLDMALFMSTNSSQRQSKLRYLRTIWNYRRQQDFI